MILLFRDYELDLGVQELRRAGEIVHVEPQVFDLLVYLVRNRERVVSKDELLDAIWEGRIVSEAALSSRINAARRAIGDTGNDQALIRTVHKRGFRFVGEVRLRSDGPDGKSIAEGDVGASRRAAAPASAAPDNGLIERAEAAAPVQAQAAKGPVLPFGPSHASIAVLPFTNLSQESEYDYFGYGMTEDIIRLLARNRWLKVITRHSTFAYRGPNVDVRGAGEALGVRYVLIGSVRKLGDHLRITAELVGTSDGSQLWAETYDFRVTDIFAIQNEMAQQIAASIEPELSSIEQQLAARKPPDSLDAWDCYQRGLWHFWAFTTPGFAEAEKWYCRAISIEPGLARAHAGLAYTKVQQAFYDDPAKRPDILEAALASAKTAVALDQQDCVCHCVLGRAYTLLRNYDEAIAELEAAIALNPSFAQAYFALGFTLIWCGRAEEAVVLFERAAELSPRDPHLWTFHHMRAMAHLVLDQLEDAEEFGRRAVRLPNATYWPFATLTATLGLRGKHGDGRAAAAQLLQRKPNYSCGYARQDFFFCDDPGFVERFAEGLRQAGIPD